MNSSYLRLPINLLDDSTVVTRDGEYLGTWGTDGSDAIYEFTPDGSSHPLLRNPFLGPLCEAILGWHSKNSPAP